ncbi:CU044_5270 family protein [Nonomuraea sp. NPDC003727]
MNELDLIKEYHDGLPGPSRRASARAWSRLAAQAQAPEGLGPVPARGRGLRRLAFRVGVVAALVSAVSAGVVVVGGDGGGSPLSLRPANAAELLEQAAAASLKDPRPRADQFVYLDRKDLQYHIGSGPEGEWEGAQEVRREIWVPAAPDGEVITRATFGKDVLTRGKPYEGQAAEGTVNYYRGDQCVAIAGGVLRRDAGEFPTEPGALLAKVRQEAEREVRDPSTFDQELAPEEIPILVEGFVVDKLVSLVENPFATPEIRATVFRALKTMPNVTIAPDLADAAGRHGIGAEISWAGLEGRQRSEIVFEQETFKLFGWRHFEELKQPDGGVKETLTGSTALMASEVVDSTPEIPAGNEPQYPC